MIGNLEPYPKESGVCIYETSWCDQDEIFYYIGSHIYKSQDSYIGSRFFDKTKIYNRRYLQETTKENRFIDEEKWIKVYKEKYGNKCINLHLKPGQRWANGGILWTQERRNSFNKTCQEKFGGHPFQNQEIKEKIKETYQEKYGVKHHLQRTDQQEKQKKTNLEKYGVENISQDETIKQRKKETFLNNDGIYFEKAREAAKQPEVRKRATAKSRIKLLEAKRKYWTNGIDNKLIPEKEVPPEGWWLGRTKDWKRNSPRKTN